MRILYRVYSRCRLGYIAGVCLLLVACDHGIDIEGEGRVVSASGIRDCNWEEAPCLFTIRGAYNEIYTAEPSEGWTFVEWRKCGPTEGRQCVFNVPADVVQRFEGRQMAPSVAVFERLAKGVEVPAFETLTEQTVDEQGGLVNAGGLEVVIPPGALDESMEIRIEVSDEEVFADDQIGPTYRVSGFSSLPEEDLELSIDSAGMYDDSMLIMLGFPGFAADLGVEAIGRTFVEAQLVNGRVRIKLPTNSDADPAVSDPELDIEVEDSDLIGFAPKQRAEISPGIGSVIIAGAQGWSFQLSEHFKVFYPLLGSFTNAQVSVLVDALEEAYTRYEQMGYDLTGRKYPVQVTLVKDLSGDGFTNQSGWGVNSDAIQIKLDLLAQPGTLRLSAAHEFFHIVQNLHDPRGFVSRGYPPQHYWLNEATATWAESLFEPDHVPSPQAQNEMDPFMGFHNGVVGDDKKSIARARAYGYGMAAYIRYLTDLEGNDWLRRLYARIKTDGVNTAADSVSFLDDAITSSVAETWPAFLQAYSQGSPYDVSTRDAIGSQQRRFRFEILDKEVLSRTFTHSFPDLGGEWFSAIVRKPDILPENASFRISATGAFTDIVAFKLVNSATPLQFLGAGRGAVVVPNIDKFSAGQQVFALVSNSRALPPYTEFTEQTVSMAVIDAIKILAIQNRGETVFNENPTADDISRADIQLAGSPEALTIGLRFDNAVSLSVVQNFPLVTNPQDAFLYGISGVDTTPADCFELDCISSATLPTSIQYGDYSIAQTEVLSGSPGNVTPLQSGGIYAVQVLTNDESGAQIVFQFDDES